MKRALVTSFVIAGGLLGSLAPATIAHAGVLSNPTPVTFGGQQVTRYNNLIEELAYGQYIEYEYGYIYKLPNGSWGADGSGDTELMPNTQGYANGGEILYDYGNNLATAGVITKDTMTVAPKPQPAPPAPTPQPQPQPAPQPAPVSRPAAQASSPAQSTPAPVKQAPVQTTTATLAKPAPSTQPASPATNVVSPSTSASNTDTTKYNNGTTSTTNGLVTAEAPNGSNATASNTATNTVSNTDEDKTASALSPVVFAVPIAAIVLIFIALVVAVKKGLIKAGTLGDLVGRFKKNK
jgi:hypothetical protein